MFNGIIKNTGIINKIYRKNNNCILEISSKIRFLKEGLVDILQLFISGENLGKNGNSSFRKNMRLFLRKKKFTQEKVNLFNDKLITYQIK